METYKELLSRRKKRRIKKCKVIEKYSSEYGKLEDIKLLKEQSSTNDNISCIKRNWNDKMIINYINKQNKQ